MIWSVIWIQLKCPIHPQLRVPVLLLGALLQGRHLHHLLTPVRRLLRRGCVRRGQRQWAHQVGAVNIAKSSFLTDDRLCDNKSSRCVPMCRMVDGRAELVGLVSFGVGCNSTLNGRPHHNIVTCIGVTCHGVTCHVSRGEAARGVLQGDGGPGLDTGHHQ